MTRKYPKSVREYLSLCPQPFRGWLSTIRTTVRKMSPDIEESIVYGMPTYSVEGRGLIYFAGWTKHYSIYPASKLVVKRLKKELKPYEVERGTIRFRWGTPVPVKLIESIVKIRAEEELGTPTLERPWNSIERLTEDFPSLAPSSGARKGAAASTRRATKRRRRK